MQKQLRFKLGDRVTAHVVDKRVHSYVGSVTEVFGENLGEQFAGSVYDITVESCSCGGCVGEIVTAAAWELNPQKD